MTNTTNPNLFRLIRELRKLSKQKNVNIWRRIAEDLEKPVRQRREVNIERINRVTKDKETIIVPGKVLGYGELDHNIKVAAFRFSEEAKRKIKNAITIQELMKENPKGNRIRIIG